MHLLVFSVLLLPATLAHRHQRPGYSHSIHHLPLSATAVSSGVPIPSTESDAPYGIGNTTTVAASTGFTTAVSTSVKSSDIADVGATATSSVVLNDLHAGSPDGLDGGDAASTPCDSGVVTVTENPTYTVTVTPAQESTSEAEVSSSIDAVPAQSPTSTKDVISSVVESSVEPTTSSAPVVDTSSTDTSAASISTTEATSTSEAVSTSAVEATVSSSSTSASQSLSTVTVVPIPATTSVAETTPSTSSSTALSSSPPPSSSSSSTPEPEPTTQTSKAPIVATVVSSSTTPTQTIKSNSGGSSPGGCPGKRGIVATAGGPNQDQGNISLAYANQPNICWIANWFSAAPPFWPKEKEYVPQYYGENSPDRGWKENADQAIRRGQTTFLSLGEPYGRTSVQDAIDLHKSHLQNWTDAGATKICSPAVLQPPEHLAWLAEFLDKCEEQDCRVDMICIHWFDTTSVKTPGFPEFKRTVEKAIELGKGKKVWVDNFQANGIPEDVKTFLDEALPYLEGNEHVERYAYVPPLRTDPNKYGPGFRTDQFIDPNLSSNGALTDLGRYYANFKMGA